MRRFSHNWVLAIAVGACLAAAAPAAAQEGSPGVQPIATIAAAMVGDLHGIVEDDRGEPVAGAVVSCLGAVTVFAVTDSQGRFSFRNLIPGPYLLRAHLQGYVPAQGRITQVSANARNTSRISLARRDRGDGGSTTVLEAGLAAGSGDDREAADDTHDHGEMAWRLRHLRRSVLRDIEPGVIDAPADSQGLGDSLAEMGRAVGESARVATAVFADLPLSGQIDLLTTTSFDRPQDLFAADRPLPRGVAQIAVSAPSAGGEWSMRGGMTQGDLASWILAGSYQRMGPAAHRYQAGMAYATQRYLGGNADALAAVTDGSRNVGSVHAFDDWTVTPQLSVGYGAAYARYDYMPDRALFSPRASVTVRPSPTDDLRIRALAVRKESAPGAEEFIVPSAGVWLPPERTFSPLSSARSFTAERLDHLELAAERESIAGLLIGVRAFRQHVDDQLVTMFGVAQPGRAPATLGHYYVASAGDLEARGWSVSISRTLDDHFRASIDYTQVSTRWVGSSPDVETLSVVALSTIRDDRERVHDITTTFEGVTPVTDTRVFVLYKVNTALSAAETDRIGGSAGGRFDVRVNQSLPFLNFGNAEVEMLVAVRNLFREDLLESSFYDELLVVRPPKRIVGGLTVRF